MPWFNWIGFRTFLVRTSAAFRSPSSRTRVNGPEGVLPGVRGRCAAAAAALGTVGIFSTTAALAGPCSDQIARLEQARNAVPNTRQSVAAQLHRQPTPSTVANAEADARKQLDATLAAARKLDADGKESECLALLEKNVPR